jgi:2',3'-cyclic-nucleotide 2'-phosphodiesterase (5'-nucleotidase family)
MKPYQSRTSTMNLPVTPLFLRTPTSIFIISNMGLMVLIICLLSVLLAPAAGQYTTVAIVALNDIHGSALPTLMEREDTKQNYTYGGLQYMAGLINQIQD